MKYFSKPDYGIILEAFGVITTIFLGITGCLLYVITLGWFSPCDVLDDWISYCKKVGIFQ